MVKNKRVSYANADSSPLYYLGRAVWSAVRFFFLLGMTFVILYPLLYMLSMSLRAGADMYDMSVVWIPKHFTLDNFRVVFEQLGFGTAMLNTIEIALGCAVIQVFVCALTGYGFARFPFKGRGLLFLVVIFTIVVPPQMTNLPNYLLFHDFDFFGIVQAATGRATEINLLDRRSTLYLLALLGQGIRSGLFILIFRQYFRGVPMELEQAAMVDGCGFGRTYFRIMLPNAKGPMLITFLFTLVWYWSDFYTLSTYLSNVRTLSVSLASLRVSLETVLSVEAWDPYKIITMEQAACIASIVPLLVLFIVLQRQFTRSIETTGLVG